MVQPPAKALPWCLSRVTAMRPAIRRARPVSWAAIWLAHHRDLFAAGVTTSPRVLADFLSTPSGGGHLPALRRRRRAGTSASHSPTGRPIAIHEPRNPRLLWPAVADSRGRAIPGRSSGRRWSACSRLRAERLPSRAIPAMPSAVGRFTCNRQLRPGSLGTRATRKSARARCFGRSHGLGPDCRAPSGNLRLGCWSGPP